MCDLLRLKDCHLFGLSVIQSKRTISPGRVICSVFSVHLCTHADGAERFTMLIDASSPGRNVPQTDLLASNKECDLNVTSPAYVSRRRPVSQGLLTPTVSHCAGRLFLRSQAQTVGLAVSQRVATVGGSCTTDGVFQ